MIRAILFDCNGIIADDEPIHLRLFQKVLKEEGINLTRKEYFKKYLAMDDRSCFKDVLKVHNRPYGKKQIQELVQRKAVYYKKVIQKELRIFSGVQSFVRRYRNQYVMAVVSGALRHEIDLILKRAGISSAFSIIVSAEDIQNGKPDPECYLECFKKLNRLAQYKKNPLKTNECVAIEDSIHGAESAHRAGMKCIAVTNSYSREDLYRADYVVKSLAGLNIRDLKF